MKRALIALLCLQSVAAAEPRTLRMAAIAPDGTAWARELHAMSRDIETATAGALKIKWYLGGIAGDEPTALERVRRGQLDGEAGAIFCQSLAPSMRVVRLPGLFRDFDEALYVLGRLKGTLDREFRKSGFANLGEAGFGFDILLSRQPMRTLAELKRGRIWVWALAPISRVTITAAGLHLFTGPVEEAGRDYEQQHLDGMIGIATAALAYQWSTEARYFMTLPGSFMPGCIVVSNATFDSLPLAEQEAVKTVGAKFFARFNDVNRSTERALVDGLFEKQGLKRVVASPALVRDYQAALVAARSQISEALLPKALMEQVGEWLRTYREGQVSRGH